MYSKPGAESDQAWVPASSTLLNPVNALGDADTLWTAPLTLPAPRGSQPMRFVIEEYETYRDRLPAERTGSEPVGVRRCSELVGHPGPSLDGRIEQQPSRSAHHCSVGNRRRAHHRDPALH
jgi:hypothetical protein